MMQYCFLQGVAHLLKKEVKADLNFIPRSILLRCVNLAINNYRIAGKFGGELNLAVWRSILQPPN